MTHPRPSQAWLADTASLLLLGGALAKILPAVAAAVAAVWYSILIWECEYTRRWRRRWRGLAYILVGRSVDTNEDRDAILKKLEAIRAAREDYVLIAVTLGLAGAGIAMALIVMFGGLL